MTKPHAVFIIGAPRSGTKLLRYLLNTHPDISLGHEGNYIPAFIRRFGLDADLSRLSLRREIYREFRHTSFYDREARGGIKLSEGAFMDALTSCEAQGAVTWANIFEVLLRAYGPHPQSPIYGDKSHGYMDAVETLRSIFGDVRFIYIVRDPRDQALSSLKTYGRSPLRAAHHWLAVARKADTLGFDTAPDVITVRYEDLTEDTDGALRRICAFLGVPYKPGMAVLKSPAERERRGRQLKSVTKQHAKYRDVLSPDVIRDISEIALPYLAKYGYPEEGAVQHRTFAPARLRLLRFTDGFASLGFHMAEKGWVKGAGYYFRRHLEGVWLGSPRGGRRQVPDRSGWSVRPNPAALHGSASIDAATLVKNRDHLHTKPERPVQPVPSVINEPFSSQGDPDALPLKLPQPPQTGRGARVLQVAAHRAHAPLPHDEVRHKTR